MKYCAAFNDTALTHPFGASPHVYKTGGRIFALISDEGDKLKISLKCDPDHSVELRGHYAGISPGYHLNKQLWITVELPSDVSVDMARELIAHSYDEVRRKLAKNSKRSDRNRI